MVSEKESAGIRRFVVKQLRDESDLSTLTLGMLKKRYLAHVNCESLSPEAKKFMKQVAEEELLKMQENYESDTEIQKPQNKRKREKQEVKREEEKESRAKKSRSHVSSSSSDSEDDEDHKTESPKQIRSHSKDAKKDMRKSDQKATKNTKQQITTSDDDSSDEEMNGSEKSENESPEVKGKKNTPKKEETRSAKTNGKKTQESDKESENDSETNDKSNASGSSDDEKEKKVLAQKKTESDSESDSDSSSLPSLEDEKKSETEDAKSKNKKMKKKDRSSQSQKGDNKTVVRLKRYIFVCGARRNYKKLLDGCRSTRSKVAVLKKELEDLGVHGNPTIDKCKRVKMKREEAQELAELDVGNIINTQGRSKRRGISTRQDPPSSTYQRALSSGSESEGNNPDKGSKKVSAWANLRGIISDDADSD